MHYPLTRPAFARPAAAPRRHAHERAAELLARYPDLSPFQLDELVGVFPRLTALDLSLMMSDDKLGPRLEAFCSAHRELIAPSLADFAVIAAILSLPVLVLVAMTFAGAG